MAWLDGWDKRIKITIDSTKIDSDLTQFPVLVHLSTASGISALDVSRVFTELGANSLKLAITQADGTTEQKVEIEKWDNGNNVAWLWVSKAAWVISSTADTVLYLYYDSTHADNSTNVGVVASTPGKAVYLANFILFDHLADGVDTSHTKDSSNSGSNGTKRAAASPAVTTSGQVGDAQDFTAASVDYIGYGTGLGLLTTITLSAIYKRDATGDTALFNRRDTGTTSRVNYHLGFSGNHIQFYYRNSAGTAYHIWESTSAYSDTAAFHQLAISFTYGTGSSIIVVRDGVQVAGSWTTGNGNEAVYNGSMSTRIGATTINTQAFDGIIDEAYISNTTLSLAWMVADYYNCWDSLITYSIENFPNDIDSLQVRIAFESTPLDTTPTWDYVQDEVREIHTSRGRNHELDRMESGALSIVFNNQNGNLWPDNAGGDYDPNVDVMKKINIACIYDGTRYDVYTGYIESYTPGWLSPGGYGAIMTLDCTGILGKVVSLQVLNDGVGYSAEASGTRVDNVLTDCGIDSSWVSSDAGSMNVQASGALANINALDHLQKLQETELSLLYELPDGTILYESRGHRNIAPHDTAQAIFGEDGGSEIPYTSFTFVRDETLLFNDARITRTGGTEQTTTNSTSQTNYGVRSFVRTGTLHNTDIDAFIISTFISARYSTPASRVETMTLVPDNSTKWVQIFNREISDRITFRNDAVGIDTDYFIESVSHNWDFVGHNFSTTYSLSNCVRYLYSPDALDETIRPNGAGDHTGLDTQFPASANHWDKVDEVIADDDTTYVQLTSNPGGGEYDLYAFPDSSYGLGTINSVKIYARFKGAADSFISSVAKVGGTLYDEEDTSAGTGSWANYLLKTYALSPKTGLAWTWAELNASQFGVRLNFSFNAGRCTQVWIVANFTPTW